MKSPFQKLLIFCAVAIVGTILAMSARPQAGLEQIKQVGMAQNEDFDTLEHDNACPCLRCYAEKYFHEPVPMPKSEEFIENPYLQFVCYPFMQVADYVWEDCDRVLEEAQVRRLRKDYIDYLQRKKIDLDNVPVILKNQSNTFSSYQTRRRKGRGKMTAPERVEPMSKIN